MGTKPIIQNQSALTPLYARYRTLLCQADPLLDRRLRAGAMQRVAFETLTDAFDVILLDAFGVLNRGQTALDGAPESVARLRAQHHPFFVVSNNASQSPERLASRLHAMGFDIRQEEILSSGMAVQPFVATSRFCDLPYYLVGTRDSAQAYAPDPNRLMTNRPEDFDATQTPASPQTTSEGGRAKYILLCSNRGYYGGVQQRHVEALLAKEPLPILLANPDLVAPDASGGVSVVAGYTAAQWVERFECELVGVGKPFPALFSMARHRFPHVPPERFLMVGDTLDTDILGGAAQGFRTCLALSGVYAGAEETLETLCTTRGIRPDFVISSIAT